MTKQKEWKNIASILMENRHNLRTLLTHENMRIRIQFFIVFIIFVLISTMMTIVNIFTGYRLLMYSTLIFAILNLINAGLTFSGEKGEFLTRILFAVEIIALFAFFAISGTPQGFSAIWIVLLPSSGLLLYRLKVGSILSCIMLLIVVFLFWTSPGRALLQYEYTESFLLRFPLLYVSFFSVGVFFEFLRATTQKELSETRERFKYLSNHDALTGLYNRLGFNQYLDTYMLERKKTGFAFAILDIDDFKLVNDHYGHANGDVVLIKLARTIEEVVGTSGVASRWGGEEFAIFLNDTRSAQHCCEEVLRHIRELRFTVENETFSVTVSCGLSEVKPNSEVTAAALVINTDQNLYSAKGSGKDRMVHNVL